MSEISFYIEAFDGDAFAAWVRDKSEIGSMVAKYANMELTESTCSPRRELTETEKRWEYEDACAVADEYQGKVLV